MLLVCDAVRVMDNDFDRDVERLNEGERLLVNDTLRLKVPLDDLVNVLEAVGALDNVKVPVVVWDSDKVLDMVSDSLSVRSFVIDVDTEALAVTSRDEVNEVDDDASMLDDRVEVVVGVREPNDLVCSDVTLVVGDLDSESDLLGDALGVLDGV